MCGFRIAGDEAGFSIQMYHNGEIRGNYYVNGSVDWFDYCDKDRMSMTEIDAMLKELGHDGRINYWYSIPGDNFDGGLVKLSEDADVLDMLVFVPDTRVVIEELNEEGLNQEAGGEGKELNEEGLTEQAGGQGKELNEVGFTEQAGGQGKALNEVGLTKDGFTDEASKQGKETATVNNEENSDQVQEKPTQGCFDKGKGKDQDMSHRVKRAFGKKRCGSLRRTKTIHHKDKAVEGRVDGVKTQSKRHSMMWRSGRRLANAADFEDDDDDASDTETSLSRIPNTQDSVKCGQCGKKGHNKRTCHRNLPPKPKPATKRKRGTENTQTTIDPSAASTLAAGPSTLKQRSKPPRRVQKGKPRPKPSKKGRATSEAQPASTSCPRPSTSISTARSNVVD
ncbi:hypothetical protein ACE6H2_002726 [Prunus campanulata]